MPELQTLEISYSRKVQLDQFEPVEYGATATYSVSESEQDELDEIIKDKSRQLESSVDREIVRRISVKKMEDGRSDD